MRQMNRAVTLTLATVLIPVAAHAQAELPQLSKEYIRAGGRLIAVENGPYVAPASVNSVSPVGGKGMSQVFTVTYGDAPSYTNITDAFFLIENANQPQPPTNGVPACYLKYNVQTNMFYLMDNSVSTWQAVTPGSAGSAQNSQCKLVGSSSSASGAGSTLTVNFALSFFEGSSFESPTPKPLWGKAINVNYGTGGWQNQASWVWAVDDPPPPSPVSLTPTSGSGLSQVFTATYTDPAGYTDIMDALFLVQTNTDGHYACFLKYNVQTNTLWLDNDIALTWLGPIAPGSLQYVENSQCILSGSGSTAAGSGNSLTVNFALGFKTAFNGAKNTWMWVWNVGGQSSGWIQMGSWTVAPLAQPPGQFSVAPSSGQSSNPTIFHFAFQSPNGFEYLYQTWMLFSFGIYGANSCQLMYDRNANAIYLFNDQATQLIGGYAPGTAATIQNGQCTIDVANTSVTGAFNTLTVSPKITFDPTFPGLQNVYMYAGDQGNQGYGWAQVGTWTAFPASPQVPTLSVSPLAAAGMNKTFTFHSNDVNGYKYMIEQLIMINTSVTSPNSCYILHMPAENAIALLDDSGNNWSNRIALGTATTLSNSQCSVNLGTSSSSGSGNDLYLNLAMTFTSSYQGVKNIYFLSYDRANNNSGWQQLTTFNVSPLKAVSVSPSAGSVASQIFSVNYVDPAGYTDVTNALLLIQTSVTGVNACYLRYNLQANAFYMTDDAATVWQGPVAPGSSAIVQNSQCVLNGATSSAAGSGPNLTVSFGLMFRTGAFSGAKNTYAYVETFTSGSAGWLPQLGTWTVPSTTPFRPDSVSPSSGSGSNRVFAVSYVDPTGYADIGDAILLLDTSVTGVNACYLKYSVQANAFYLTNDQATVWQGPVTPGSAATVQNSQCILSGATSSAMGSGANLAVNFGLSLKTGSFSGARNVYGSMTTTATGPSGWPQLGTWTVP